MSALFSAKNIIVIPNTGSISNKSTKHYHFVMRAKDDAGRTFLVPVGTTRPNCDRTVILTEQECPILRRESFVLYGRAKLWRRSDLDENVRRGICTVHEYVMDEELFHAVKSGFFRSKFSSGWTRKYITGCDGKN